MRRAARPFGNAEVVMSLADFQNPIANSPHIAQSSGAHQTQTANIPQNFSQEQLREDNELADTVEETKDSAEQDAIREDEQRGEQQKEAARRRARKAGEEEREAELPPIDDGVHGSFDLRA